MIPFLTHMVVRCQKIQILCPYIAKNINHNVLNDSKVMNIIHTIIGNPCHSGEQNRQPEDIGSDMMVFFGMKDHEGIHGKTNNNAMHMTRLNPNVSPKKESITTSLLPFDDNYIEHINSDNFRQFLLLDGTTKDGQQAIAEHYEVLDEWNNLKDDNNDFLTLYYKLLLLVKTKNTKDNVWISFVEGLHRHAALVLSLLCSKFDYLDNNLTPGSLDMTTFEKAGIQHFKLPEDSTVTPEHLLNDINNTESDYLSMLKQPFHVKALYPCDNNCDINTLTAALMEKSSSHSRNKLNSAHKSISIVTAEGLNELMNNSTAAERNDTNEQPIFDIRMKFLEMNNKQYESKVIEDGNDTFLEYPIFLVNKEWLNYIKDPFNSMTRNSLIDTVCPLSTKYEKKHQPPFGLYYNNITRNDIYAKTGKKYCGINSINVNALFAIPLIVNSLVDKLEPHKRFGSNDGLKVNMIHYLTRIGCVMTKAPNLHIHPAINHYCNQAKDSVYIQGLSGIYKVIPVTAFLVMLYNASFMFNDDKSGNFLISALTRFDLGTTVMDETFMELLSKFMKYVKFASFSKLEIYAFFVINIFPFVSYSLQTVYLGIFMMQHILYQPKLQGRNSTKIKIMEKCSSFRISCIIGFVMNVLKC